MPKRTARPLRLVGRPNRNQRVTLYLTTEELAELVDDATYAHLTVSDFMRKCLGLPLAVEITALTGRPSKRQLDRRRTASHIPAE